MPLNIIELDAKNVTDKFCSAGQQGLYKCKEGATVRISESNNTIQVLHFSSPTCRTCTDEAEKWKKLPREINNLTRKNESQDFQVEIIEVIDESLVEDSRTKTFIERIMQAHTSNEKTNEEISLQNNIMRCVVTMSSDDIERMNINLLPYTIAIKKGKIIAAFGGKTGESEVARLAGIISRNIN